MKRILIVLGLILAGLIGSLFVPRADKAHLVMAEPYVMGPVPDAVERVRSKSDYIKEKLVHVTSEMPGHDDIVLFEENGFALATAMDGWIWKIDLASGRTERFVDVPLVASGAVRIPGDPDRIYACVSRLHGEPQAEGEKVGVYEIRLSTKQVRPVFTDVLIPPDLTTAARETPGVVYAEGKMPVLQLSHKSAANSQPMAFCNDLAISADGRRLYVTTPYSYAGAAMGGGAFGEAITLARNGLLWRYTINTNTVELVARDFNFIDGILVENRGTQVEESVIITETTKFRIDRLKFGGTDRGTYEVLWENLPGMPDGLDRDKDGRIYVGVIKKRTGFITWAHRNVWIKYGLLNLPQWLLPIPKETGLLILNADASRPLFFTEHNGSGPGEIAVAVPGRDGIYLPNFRKTSRGFFRIPYPEELKAEAVR